MRREGRGAGSRRCGEAPGGRLTISLIPFGRLGWGGGRRAVGGARGVEEVAPFDAGNGLRRGWAGPWPAERIGRGANIRLGTARRSDKGGAGDRVHAIHRLGIVGLVEWDW